MAGPQSPATPDALSSMGAVLEAGGRVGCLATDHFDPERHKSTVVIRIITPFLERPRCSVRSYKESWM